MKFLHISDLHISGNIKLNNREEKLLKKIKDKYPDHYLILTGDITDDGKIEQYKNAYKLLKPFKNKIFICPGNHDFGAKGNFYSRERAKRFDNLLMDKLNQGGNFYDNNQPVINVLSEDDIKVMIISLDSNLETEHVLDTACGKVGRKQRNYLDQVLSDEDNLSMKKIVLLHHHPFLHGFKNIVLKLKDAKKFRKVIRNRVDVVMYGHKHRYEKVRKKDGLIYLASDNSGNSFKVRELSITNEDLKIKDLKIS
jgi:3',5'-cyclic AMP phosphodiesterase CpdA